jgi:hypothetical protein
MWTVCHRDTIARLATGGPHHQALSRTRSTVSPDIAELVYAQLCERVEQELRLLRDRLQSSNLRSARRVEGLQAETPVVLRRLSREEAESVTRGRDEQESMIALFDLGDVPADHAPDDIVDGSGEAESLPPPDLGADDLPIVGSTGRIPLYPLARIFPAQRLAYLRGLFEGVLHVEALEQKRARRAAGEHVYRPAVEGGGDEMSDLVALYTHARTSSKGRAGDAGVDLAIAFWRLRCFFGQGWEEFDVDKSGRKV